VTQFFMVHTDREKFFISLGFCHFSLTDIEQMCHSWYTWKGKQSSETEPSILVEDHQRDIVLHWKHILVLWDRLPPLSDPWN